MKNLIVYGLILLITGCAGVGYMATSDPDMKIQQAYSLMSQDRPVLAEDIIQQAMTIYKKRNNTLGIAESYFAFGNLYVSSSYRDNAKAFMRLGTYDGTYEKALKNLQKGKELFTAIGSEIGVVKSDVTIGNAYIGQSNTTEACKYYVTALSRYKAGKKAGTIQNDPTIRVDVHGSMGQILRSYVSHYKCST